MSSTVDDSATHPPVLSIVDVDEVRDSAAVFERRKADAVL